eukprot:7242583-Pyramimonas_sp.AAC.1
MRIHKQHNKLSLTASSQSHSDLVPQIGILPARRGVPPRAPVVRNSTVARDEIRAPAGHPDGDEHREQLPPRVTLPCPWEAPPTPSRRGPEGRSCSR